VVPSFLERGGRAWPAENHPVTACTCEDVLCTDVYPVQVRYNKKEEKIQATFVFEAVNDRTGALILRLTQRLVLGLTCYVVSHVYYGV